MFKKSRFSNFFKTICSIPFLFMLTCSSVYAAPPGFLEDWGTYTWRGNADNPYRNLNHNIKIVDHDGISSDGSSHTVTVAYPASAVHTMAFQYRENETTAVYGFYHQNFSGDATGDYVYRVTDLATGDWTEMMDNVQDRPLEIPDETTFSPGYGSPVFLAAEFDDVYVNGVLYDNFEAGFDETKWEALTGGVSIDSGLAQFAYTWDTAEGKSISVNLNNPGAVNELKAIVKINESNGDMPYARIGGNYCSDGLGVISAKLGIRENEVVLHVCKEYKETYQGKTHHKWIELMPQTLFRPVTAGNRYELTLGWDGTRFDFQVRGLDDSTLYSDSYSLSGSIADLAYPTRFIGITSWPKEVSTAPVFDWAETTGANHYRIRIYNMDYTTLYTGYTKAPPFEMPPDILLPNAEYRYRIYAQGEHQWFEADNVAASNRNIAWFTTGPEEAQSPYIDFDGHGVFTWAHDPVFESFTAFWMYIHDAQGVPENIKSVKVLFPDGITENILYHDYNLSSTKAAYGNLYFGPIQSGLYTITVTDKDLNVYTKSEVLSSDPMEFPMGFSIVPEHNSLLGSTGMNIDWDYIPGAAFYQINFYDKDINFLFRLRTTESEFDLWPGLLKEESLYRYQIRAYGEFFEETIDNMAKSPVDGAWNGNIIQTTAKHGTNQPEAWLGRYGVSLYHGPNPATEAPTYSLVFDLLVKDLDGVPENIQKVEVVYPDGATKCILKYLDKPEMGRNYYADQWLTDLSLIQDAGNSSGIYTFMVTDFDGNMVTLYDTLPDVSGSDNGLMPLAANANPPQGSVLNTKTPVISWDEVPGASCYRIRIYNARGTKTLHWSPDLTENMYMVPCGILEPETVYAYKVYAYDGLEFEDIDFWSGHRLFDADAYHFTTGQTCSGDFNGDNDLDGTDLFSFIFQLSQGTASFTLKDFASLFGSPNNFIAAFPTYQIITQHYANSYGLGMGFGDDDVDYVSVDGPNIDQIHRHPSSIAVTLTGRPAIGDQYIFHIQYVNGKNNDQLFTVRGINDRFVSLISPGDGQIISSTTPVLEWEDIKGINLLQLVVSDDTGIIWWSPSFPVGTNSCEYNFDGTAIKALEPGKTYWVQLNAHDERNDQATTRSSFHILDN